MKWLRALVERLFIVSRPSANKVWSVGMYYGDLEEIRESDAEQYARLVRRRIEAMTERAKEHFGV